MPQYETTRRVNHSASAMYALVCDVESYPEFLPMCEALTIQSSREKPPQKLITADMTVGYKAIQETFTSRVLMNDQEQTIETNYLDGPFEYLDNKWRFEAIDDTSCDVVFFIDYKFKNKMLGMVMGAMFDRAFRLFAEAFEKRADAIYTS